MKKYSAYKDSGIDWIGDIPSHWEAKRVDWVLNIVRGNSAFKRDELLDNGEYIALQYGKTYKVDVVDDNFKFFVNNEFYKENQVVSRGDTILISTSETVEDLGHTCYYDNETIGLLGGEQILLKPNHEVLYKKYLYYYTRQLGSLLRKYAKGLKVYRFNTNDLKQLFFAIPPLEEQTTIANYLDRKTAEIDDLIAKKERLIELYKEERIATINQAVTKGLDPNVPMKDSGIEWLGEIPEHWEVCHFKMISKRIEVGIAEAATQAYVEEGGVPILRATNIKNGKVKGELLRINNELAEKNKSKTIFKNDLVTVRTGYPGVTALIQDDLDGCQCFTMLITTLLDGNSPQFYNYYLNSNVGKSYFKLTAWGSAQKNISVPILSNIPTVKMLYDEQVLIADYIEKASQEFGTLIDKTEKEIDLLKEYKTALISEVVLGKVDVREEELDVV